ncbi:metallophosphoesterase family protein [Labrys miyagiensis]
MSKLFLTADTHFGHESIIRLCKRPFDNLEAMDEALITRWNSKVAPNDVVYHLGDISFRAGKPAETYLERLNGQIHLVIGNHDDREKLEAAGRLRSISDIKEIAWNGQRIVLCHYPMREWPGAWRGAWHLFGHVHGNLDNAPLGYSLDVGVDSHGYAPLSINEVAAIMATRSKHFGS